MRLLLCLTDDCQGEAIAESCDFIIGTAPVDLKNCHPNEFCQQRSPQTPAVSMHLHAGSLVTAIKYSLKKLPSRHMLVLDNSPSKAPSFGDPLHLLPSAHNTHFRESEYRRIPF